MPSAPTSNLETSARTVPEPRAPGRGRFLWWESVVPVAISAVLALLALPARDAGGVGGFLLVSAFLAAAFWTGRAVGLRRPQTSAFRATARGALSAELFTLGAAAALTLISPDDGGDLSLRSLLFALAFAHLLCLPPLLLIAGLGVASGSD